MGEVYRARDTKLGRLVAIKVLPEALAADPERITRFEREAKTLAALNHPHIATLFGLDHVDGRHLLIMELVDGDTLADRIAEGPIPFDEALPIAQQIADALETAHEQGIVHRDLKPANIKLRPDGTVKVLDFGLAKALDSSSATSLRGPGLETASPTITTPAMTMAGVILGPAAYLSPEQAKGRAADKRSDVWAFGCVLFEMLAGRRAFEGEDVSDTLAAVLRGEPRWSALPPDLPPTVQQLIKGCLERDRRQRVGDVAAARLVLRNADTTTAAAGTPHVPRRPLRRRAAPLVAGSVAIGALGIVVGRTLQPAERPPQVPRFAIPLPPGQRFYETGGQVIAISPDGSHVAYIANQRIYARALSELESRPVAGTEANGDRLSNLTFSPDSQSLAFFVSNANATVAA